MFFKVQGVEGSQNPERRKTVHIQEGHVGIDRQFVDWRVKGMMFPNLSKSRFNLGRQIKIESGPSNSNPCRSFRDRELDMSNIIDIRNLDIAICKIAM
jgi:hypothetical protein